MDLKIQCNIYGPLVAKELILSSSCIKTPKSLFVVIHTNSRALLELTNFKLIKDQGCRLKILSQSLSPGFKLQQSLGLEETKWLTSPAIWKHLQLSQRMLRLQFSSNRLN
jgi:hypothetical protein